jgi:hypothetical protein
MIAKSKLSKTSLREKISLDSAQKVAHESHKCKFYCNIKLKDLKILKIRLAVEFDQKDTYPKVILQIGDIWNDDVFIGCQVSSKEIPLLYFVSYKIFLNLMLHYLILLQKPFRVP